MLPASNIQQKPKTLLERMAASTKEASNTTSITNGSLVDELIEFDINGYLGPKLKLLLEFLLTIEPTSVNNERAFSTANLIITALRNRLDPIKVDQIHFLNDFLKKKF